LIARGELLVNQDRESDAAALFAEAYHRYPLLTDRPALLFRIADAFEQRGSRKRAYLWLTKAAREYPTYRFPFEGRPTSFAEYRERLSDVAARVEPSRPAVTLPLTHSFTVMWDERTQLLEPRFADVPAAEWSVFFAATDDGIRAFDARTARAVWSQPAVSRTRTQFIFASGEQAVFANLYELFALDARTGGRRWSHGSVPEHVDRVDGDWEDGRTIRQFAHFEDQLAYVHDDGTITVIDLLTGDVRWSQVHSPAPVGPVAMSERWLAYSYVDPTADEKVIIYLVDAETGAYSHAIPTQEKRSVEELFITLDGELVMATSRTVSVFDPGSGQPQWATPLEGFLRKGSLKADLDALYFSVDGRTVRKLSLADGRVVWESEALSRRGDEDITVDIVDATLLVSTPSAVAAVDAITGLTLWRGTTPEDARFIARRPSAAYLCAVHVGIEGDKPTATAYFYDHRNASGVIARDGGALALGTLGDIRSVLLVNDALLVQTGSTIQGWSRKP
jgi:outer membrane protein assembly factor BamB